MAKRGDMDDDHIKNLLASGAPIIEDLLELAQASAAAPRLQVLTLAGALAQAAVEGDVPDQFVLDVVQASLEGAREPLDERPEYRGPGARKDIP
jgi:hypothetical protein